MTATALRSLWEAKWWDAAVMVWNPHAVVVAGLQLVAGRGITPGKGSCAALGYHGVPHYNCRVQPTK